MEIPGSSAATTSVLLLVAGCSHAWDDYSPLGGETGSGGASASSSASSGSGAASSSSQSSGFRASGSGGSSGGAGSGGDGIAGGAQGGTGGMITNCPVNGTNTFSDDFEDGTLDAKWDIYGNAAEVGGVLELDPGASSTMGTFAIVRSAATFDLRNCSVMVRALQVPTGVDTAYAGLALYLDDDNYTELIISGTALHASTWIQGVLTIVASIRYQANAHAWWRIREEGGTLFYEVSANGIDFSPHSSVASPYSDAGLGAIMPALTSGTTGPTSAQLPVTRYDNLNILP